MTDEEFAEFQRNKFFKQNHRFDRSIGWFVKNVRVSSPCDFNDYKLDSRYADKFIKHCPNCNACWQLRVRASYSLPTYYEGFPTLGKEKMICPRCSTKTQQD